MENQEIVVDKEVMTTALDSAITGLTNDDIDPALMRRWLASMMKRPSKHAKARALRSQAKKNNRKKR